MNPSTYPVSQAASVALKGISPTSFAPGIPERWIPSAAGPVRAASVRIHRPKPAVSRAVPLQQESTHPESPNEPRLCAEHNSQTCAVDAEVEVVMHTAPTRSDSPPLRTDEEDWLQGFRCAMASVEGALEGIDACAVPLDQKVQAYKDQIAILAQCIQVQQESWPGFADHEDAQKALGQTLARLEAGSAELSNLQQRPMQTQDNIQAPSGDTCMTDPDPMALAKVVYTAGFRQVSHLAARTGGGAPVVNELVDLLDLAADAFNVFTGGEPPSENDFNELLKLHDALATSKLNFALLAPTKTTALRNALKLLGISAIGQKQLQMALPTLHE